MDKKRKNITVEREEKQSESFWLQGKCFLNSKPITVSHIVAFRIYFWKPCHSLFTLVG